MTYSKEEFERIKKALQEKGMDTPTKWRPGLKTIRVSDIVLSGPSDD